MIILCPECKLQVSDKAFNCPHCGYPMQKQSIPRKYNKRRKRLPNGFGRITEIKGRNLRKPFRAMVTVGKDAFGKPIGKPLKPESYFETYNEAYAALLEYNKNPYDLEPDITVSQLYEKWTDRYFKEITDGGARNIRSAWSYCTSVYTMRVKDLRARHIRGCIENGFLKLPTGEIRQSSANTKTRMKSMWNLMMDFAVEYDMTDKNYARMFDLSGNIIEERDETKRGHIIFTEEEMQCLWNNLDMPYVDVILFQCYSGWRPQELGLLRIENVLLEQNIIIGGMKTNAGKNRTVPIHAKIRPLVERFYQQAQERSSEYLINCTDGKTHTNSLIFTYDKYNKRFAKICKALGLNPDHKPHDGRMHFVTMAKKYKLDEYAIKYIVGHKIDDITERVYTQRSNEWLIEEMNKIKD